MRILPVFFLFIGTSAFADNMRAHFIDVGQADATLLEFNCGAVMIDAGTQTFSSRDSTRKLMAYLDDFFERRSDLNDTISTILVTHNHKDHTGALGPIFRKYTVENIVSTEYELNRDVINLVEDERPEVGKKYLTYRDALNRMPNGLFYEEIDPLDSNDGCGDIEPEIYVYSGLVKIPYGGVEIAGHEFQQYHFNNTKNNHSLVIKVVYGEASFLFTGDLEENGIEYLLANYRNNLEVLDVDVYQVGHHGSRNATTQPLLDAMSPAFAIISASDASDRRRGNAWDHGHPNKGIVEMMINHDSIGPRRPIYGEVFEGQETDPVSIRINRDVYCTCWDGSVVVHANPETGRYRVYRYQ